MKVLSLFDGCACARVALERSGISTENYYASEIDKWAIRIAHKNYPDMIQLGDITRWHTWNLPKLDLIIGGSPCQGFSRAGFMEGFKDERSKLFFEFVDCLSIFKPKYFLLENVYMKQEWQDIISMYLGVEPVRINSNLFSAQLRDRLYWTNIPVDLNIQDKGIVLKDILESGAVDRDKAYAIDASYWKGTNYKEYKKKKRRQIDYLPDRIGTVGKDGMGTRVYSPEGKSVCLKALGGGWGVKTGLYKMGDTIRKLTPIECERLQTLPDNYTEGVSNTQRYKMLGNGFTVDVIAHILKGI